MSESTPKPGFYASEINQTSWVVPVRYKNLFLIGRGAYGQVCGAVDEVTGKRVAVKKLKRPFLTSFIAKRTFREIRLLQHFEHENLVDLLDMFTPDRTLEDFKDFYMVMPHVGSDLNFILKYRSLDEAQVQFIIYQILRGLKYIHSAGIIHRDLKPGNISINENNELKILDFGLARSKAEEMSGYVVCRWYRAPEIILNYMHYNEKVDIWSVGCILGEIITGKPLFEGTDHINQLIKILQLIGKPSAEFIGKIASKAARDYIIDLLPQLREPDFHQVFEGASRDAIDLLEKTLDLDPETRISVYDALTHPYIAEFHDPGDEPTAQPVDNSFEDLQLDTDGWRRLTYQEIASFQPNPTSGH